MQLSRSYFILFLFLGLNFHCASADRFLKTGLWQRFEISIENSSWQGNPFDIILEVTFVSPSGRNLHHLGFYAGENTWKIYFMPDEKGKWTYQTQSDDEDLNNKSGKFTCIHSNLDAPLICDGKQWRLKNGNGDFPVIWNPAYPDGTHWGYRAHSVSDPDTEAALEFAEKVVGARLLGIGELLIAPYDWAKEWPQNAVPYVKGKEGDEFFLPFWDKLNERMDAARDRNMGAYIMLYSDDALTPDIFGITPHSEKELRFLRYVIARLACYPHILWDTGIDIGEYRNNDWINWFVSWFSEHDAWKHPVSSRSGGGSGGIMPENGSYYSLGGASLPSRAELLNYLSETKVPIAQTDHWRPFISRGNWNLQKIRTAMWRCGLSGAQALYPDFNQGIIQFDQLEQGAREIGIATNFFKNELRSDLLELAPHDELLVSAGEVILSASPGSEYVVYDEEGVGFSIDFSDTKHTFRSEWYNTRSGEKISNGKITGGKIQSFTAPAEGSDWVLHVYLQ